MEKNDFNFNIQQIQKTDKEGPNQIILSEKLQEESVFTTETKHIFSVECGRNIYGEEEIEKIVELGTKVRQFDILIHKLTPKKSSTPSNPEDRLLRAMFGEKVKEYLDTSLCVPFNVHGEVIDVKKNNLGSVSVTVLQKFPLSIGDVLVDENGKEGVVVSFSSNLEENEIVANFELGVKIAKKSIAESAVQMRSTGEYNLRAYPIPERFYYGELSHVVYGIPQSLHSQDITKLISNGFADVLKNVIALQTNQIKNRFKFYNNIVKGQLTDVIKLPFNDINAICCFLKTLCLKPVFRDENRREIPFLYSDKNYELCKSYCENLSFEIDELSDDEVRQMSYGEVVNSEAINYRTQQPEKGGLFCETIFGPKKGFECQCGKYVGNKYSGMVCGKCGVELTKSEVRYERFGHLELAKPVPHPFIPNRMLSVIPILPPELRPMLRISGGRYATSDLNDLYRSVVTRNKLLKKSIEYGNHDLIINNEERMLRESINDLFGNINEDTNAKNRNNSQTTLIDNVSHFFTQHLKYESLDYSAACNVVVDNSLSDDKCGLPLRIALELFKPFLINQLCEKGIVANIREARKLIIDVSNERNIEKKAKVIEMLQDIMSSKRILIFSKDIEGKVLSLSPVVVELSVLTLNFNQYKELKSQLDETIKIILPASDSVQAMLNNKNDFNSKQITNIFDCEDNTDFVKTLTIASLENINIIPLLLDAVKNHEICNFNTVTSQYVFGKPSKWACDFYKQPPIEDEQNEEEKSKENKLEKANNNDTKIDEIFVDLFSNDTELENLDDFTFDDLLGFYNIDNPSGDDSISTGNLFDISENSSQD